LAGEIGKCKTAVIEGQTCDVDLGPSCITPARCIVAGSGGSGVCALPAAATCG
jgi:hypothetical protein